jgi:hypothetical protein
VPTSPKGPSTTTKYSPGRTAHAADTICTTHPTKEGEMGDIQLVMKMTTCSLQAEYAKKRDEGVDGKMILTRNKKK